MNKILTVLGAIAAVLVCIVVAIFIFWQGTYNDLIAKREDVRQKWGQVENVYQRRADLVPNLVETVKGYAKHEAGVFQEVANARAAVSRVDLSKVELDPAAQKQFLESNGQLTAALSKLIAVHEAYPDLKANQGFLTLQAQLEGAENRISVERGRLQKAASEYNTRRQGFLSRMVASHYGFTAIEYYKAETENASVAPKVQF